MYKAQPYLHTTLVTHR